MVEQVPDTFAYPLQYLDYFIDNELISRSELEQSLLELISDDEKPAQDIYRVLLSYITSTDTLQAEEFTFPDQILDYLAANYGDNSVFRALVLDATTDDPEFFIQNLMASSDGELLELIAKLNPEKEGLYNSLAIVEYLIDNASEDSYSLTELFETLEDAHKNREYHIVKFHELLTDKAEGVLKSELLLIKDQVQEAENYEDILSYLLNNAQHKNYSRESVYDLLLKLIGITDVDEFAEKFI